MKYATPCLASIAAVLCAAAAFAGQEGTRPAPGEMPHSPAGHAMPMPGAGDMPAAGAGAPTPQPSDERQEIRISAGERDFVLNEMRNFLLNVQGVVAALADDKPAEVAKQARASGMGHRGHVPRSLMMKLPQEWRMLGMDTHGRFDALALEAEGLADRKQMTAQLAAILANCNGCHAAYRLVSE
ncbi:MAG: hypothetical protein JNM89_12140 [Hyphomicrobiaceae bacterium]|nr:hypothetical protein [Hyphomicrobiaceae bacterium]